MITISFSSGLGNQLFQYFFGESIKLKLQNQLPVNYINDLLPPHQIKLWDIFDNQINWIGNEEKKLIFVKFNKYFRKYFTKILFRSKLNEIFCLYNDSDYQFSKITQYKNFYLKGYWQNYKYFINEINIIKNNLVFKKKINLRECLFDKKIISKNIIGVHIRGGDYLYKQNKKLFNKISQEYYFKYMNILSRCLKDAKFIIFTDDVEYSKSIININYFDCTYSYSLYKDPLNDFQYLSQCDHFIIPNSTFSWWAAEFSNSKNKIVIAPDKWFNAEMKNFDLIRPDWIKSKINIEDTFLN